MSEELEDLVSLDPLMVVSEMATIIYNIGEAEILDVEAKQECLNDCLKIIYLCNQIVKQQIKEQYPIYFKSKKNGKTKNTGQSAENEQRGKDEVDNE